MYDAIFGATTTHYHTIVECAMPWYGTTVSFALSVVFFWPTLKLKVLLRFHPSDGGGANIIKAAKDVHIP